LDAGNSQLIAAFPWPEKLGRLPAPVLLLSWIVPDSGKKIDLKDAGQSYANLQG
jgi:hypothetical protein